MLARFYSLRKVLSLSPGCVPASSGVGGTCLCVLGTVSLNPMFFLADKKVPLLGYVTRCIA